ncbi:hypothetical protein PG993_007232 [Apiospora rasikravindrae]|uniref:Rhodopsin domain-containing protein n=1 Tax=Apiospora rasikravindrae TaxID=990691 RepID=A0ABR1SWW8_9PEZI
MNHLQPSELQNQRLVIAVVTTCITLAAASFALRCCSPLRQGGSKYWFGDYWMAGVLLLCLGMSTSEYIGVQYGYGTHANQLPPDMMIGFKQNLYSSMLLWNIGTFSVKIGILLSYWRLSPPPNHAMFQKWIIGFAYYLCRWSGPGKPLGRRIVATALLFMLGIFALVASIVRVAVVSLIDWNDVTYTFVSYNIWGIIEVLVGFTCANLLSAGPLIARWLHTDDDDSSGQDYRKFKKAYFKRHDSNGTTGETMARILATPSPEPTFMSSTGLAATATDDDTTRWTCTPTPICSYNSSHMNMQREREWEHQKQQQQQQTSEEAGEENDSIHELLTQGALIGSLRSATPSSRCATPSSMIGTGSRCVTPTTPSTPSTPGGPMHISQNHLRHQVSRISSRSSVRSSFGDIQVRRVVVLRVEGVEQGHRGQSFETHVTSCDDVSSCHSSERGLNLDTPSN